MTEKELLKIIRELKEKIRELENKIAILEARTRYIPDAPTVEIPSIWICKKGPEVKYQEYPEHRYGQEN